ncbi:MAG TPA: hypothetical protein VFI22_09835 [Thermomicrobiales bacterium]|nr:hypothetical protein [Thermomicrobiales bacterium]
MSEARPDTPRGLPPRTSTDRGSKIQMIAIVGATVFVMILGILVVSFPHQFGLPGLGATPTAVATPAP